MENYRFKYDEADDSTVEYEKEPVVGVIKERLNIPTERKPIILNINDSNTGMSGRVLSKFSKKSHTLTASGSNWIKYGYIEYDENGELIVTTRREQTTVGRAILSEVLPDGMPFSQINCVMKKKNISNRISSRNSSLSKP